MRRFSDWGRTKEWKYVDVEWPEDELYMERGCPKYALYQLLDDGYRIFQVDGKITKKLRYELGQEKTDEGDAELVKLAFESYPEKFIEFTLPEQTDFRYAFIMSRYEQTTEELAAFKNRRLAFIKEFGPLESFDSIIKILEKDKKEMLKQVAPLIAGEYAKVKHIRGLGPALLARLLAVAHPRNFKSKSAYLLYCGYTKMSRDTNKYHRKAKSILYLIALQTLMHKDEHYRQIYDDAKEASSKNTCATCWLTIGNHKCKKRKEEDQPTCKIRNHTVALNRVSTKLAKYLYKNLKNVKTYALEDFK